MSTSALIGFWPIASGLPFYVAIEKGYFKEAGLDVEPLKFASAQQVMEALQVLDARAHVSPLRNCSARLRPVVARARSRPLLM